MVIQATYSEITGMNCVTRIFDTYYKRSGI